jgi:N-acetyl-anhydromuramoyl-L-alanine amidase
VSRRRSWADGWWTRARRSPSPNAGPRPAGTTIDLVVLHSISLPPGQFGGPEVEQFFHNRLDTSAHPYFARLQDLKVSAHFFVRRTGEVLQFVSCDQRAWHAGASAWRGRTQCNDFSIGIELEGLDDGTAFCAAQYAALTRLLRAVSRVYPVREVVGHEHVAPGRKADPGAGFDWRRLARVLPSALLLPKEVREGGASATSAEAIKGTSRYER